MVKKKPDPGIKFGKCVSLDIVISECFNLFSSIVPGCTSHGTSFLIKIFICCLLFSAKKYFKPLGG